MEYNKKQSILTIERIKAEVIPLAQKYQISMVELFGSYAQGTATAQSDADFLVRFIEPTPSIFAVMGFKEELSRALDVPVDVVAFPLAHPEKLQIERTVPLYEA